MYLKQLELVGFKSFPQRTRLVFEPGITAIVGPNGSGKSNVAEVAIARRLYRSGEGEYLANGNRVRLRDVTEWLLGAGLGPDSYCVVGQGTIEQLVLQRPEERRLLLEDAADVRRHALRLAEAERDLAATSANLERARD